MQLDIVHCVFFSAFDSRCRNHRGDVLGIRLMGVNYFMKFRRKFIRIIARHIRHHGKFVEER